ncbi:MAG: GDSL-type esterase/lipase family protein [Nakamurella sp.]
MADPTLAPTPITDSILVGAAELEDRDGAVVPHRLPRWAREQNRDDAQLLMAQSHCAGVRLRVRTGATVLELATRRTTTMLRGLPPRPAGIFDLRIDGTLVEQRTASGGTTVVVDMTTGEREVQHTPTPIISFTGLPADPKDLELWLPWNEAVELVELRSDAPLEAIPTDGRPVWLHHGSSISHGSNAASPTGTWPVVAADLGGVELVNLGFGGSALLDPFLARTIRDAPADLISLKLGINLVGADLFRLRALGPAVHGFLDTIRDGHPETPLLLISALHCAIHEQTPGPGSFDPLAAQQGQIRFIATGDPAEVPAGRLTLEVIREQLRLIVEQRSATDQHLHFLDGLQLYGAQDEQDHPLPDSLHPDAASHALIGERFARAAFGPTGIFTVHL